MERSWQSALERARKHSPFLSLGLDRQPDLVALLEAGRGEEALEWAKAAGTDAPDVATALRRERWGMAVALGIGDLAGAFPLDRVMAELSAFADRAMDQAITAAIRARVEDAEPAGFTALALGKHGARELNYSSDIDPILLYDPERLPRRERDEPGEAAQRVARTLVETLSRQTADGYVFRVDLRLRPASEVSPLAISFNAALTHYESLALAWERAAFIRARACAGDIAGGEEFLRQIRSFVWRRNLDFGAIEEIRRLTARIRSHHGGPQAPGPGFDVKRGRGGIREVEFFAQTHQLIHGGRRPSLRVRGTRAALDALAAEGIIAAEDAQVLGESYDRLRVIEHRLQMVADRQTHSLPTDPDALDNVAMLDGLANGAALLDELAQITDRVASRYDALLDGPDSAASPLPLGQDGVVAERLRQLGFSDPVHLAERIAGWSDGRVRTLRSEAARAAFEAVFPTLLEALAKAPDPDRAVARWETLLINLPSAVNLFRLLEARPGLMEQLVAVLTLAPPLADELARRPDLLDALIDTSALDLPGSVEELAARMSLPDGAGYEELLDRVRRVVGETRFALGVQLIEAAQDPLEIAEALCRTAEAALAVCLKGAEAEFARVHGRIAGHDLLVLGLGRLGGGALTHASDLDLIYLFSTGGSAEQKGDENSLQSDGERPLGVTLYFNRLAQRVTAALSVATAEGPLYEVDTRLRPQGNQGPLSVSLDSFERYQKEDAWTWEHMALNRARVLAGPPAGRARLEAILAEVLHSPRDPAKLKQDVLTMRREMAAHKPPKGVLDVKLHRGGLVDLEFLIHYLQLRERIAQTPEMVGALTGLLEAALLPENLLAAQKLLIRVLVSARLLAPDSQEPSAAACGVLARSCGAPSYPALLEMLAEARHGVAAAWAATFGETLEME
ncbi:bifunctional [glutamine synthetase] adenylyltransferase/[glutamine synthetase]-adenylyl-L-tyrosine phosphorylase [Altererythrobacter sp. CC-YST694]|uniref:bifunctional [glutamine synthetase] adenylyltransferase/[glutamine synthetase]-adenylyl-L-tyrosine phosphorylase n=1 Tax=Altererythrobacter sp. CC-YST694 TaxID=2755038 RepID=UPI001D0062DA|nr:bifunctional [glutamine synthetase] adenylyltransferase/[glutamine synthetase]-adenylyl-L-tyrosine phosphorylase [Altererythrobacter sp. CC-YST694]MCB5425586.1 bifunctional [glutamine synthetase] adenylyltransferase/[glutamine synthetase]-adenylyl-L-tyrosine phosphorylase [Altererythrobacter sp. CC-YST694]